MILKSRPVVTPYRSITQTPPYAAT